MTQQHQSTPASSSTPSSPPKLWPSHVEVLRARAIPEAFAVAHGLRSVDVGALKDHCEKYKVAAPWPHLPLYRGATGIEIQYQVCLDEIRRARIRVDQTEVVLPGPIDGAHHGERTVTIPRYICQARPVTVVPYIIEEVREIAGDTTKPLFIVEAPLKALSLTANGFPAVGLGGVLAGANDTEVLDALGEIALSKEMNRIKWAERLVYVVFDAGLADNPMVALGAARLALGLQREGADVRLVTLPYYHLQDSDPLAGKFWRREDQGPDDSIARNGVDAFRLLVQQAVPADPVARIAHAASGASRTEAVAHLLGELPVQAMLYEGGALLVDQVAAPAKIGNVSKRAVQQAAKTFGERMCRRVEQDRAAWKSDLKRSASGALKPITLNVETCLRKEVTLDGLVAWDDFRQCVIFRKSPPWTDVYPDARAVTDSTPWADEDDTRLSGYLGRKHELLDVPPLKVVAALNVVARDRRFHPVREYLSSLKWDEVPRLDTFPQTYLGASPGLADYYRIVAPKWFISAVARVRQPGCKVDHTLVLEGEQGDSKTAVFRALGGDWYSDASQDDLANKEAAMKLQGAWIFVFDEGSIFSRADALAMKEFLTKEWDEIIPKFSNRKLKMARQCAFALTTNEYTYLSDATGNRRYWPMAVGVVDLEALRRDRDQLWAEAVHRYETKEEWWPTKEEEERLIAPEQDKRRQVDPWEPRIEEALKGKADTTVEYLLTDVLDYRLKDADQRVRLRVVRCLRALGWTFAGVRKVNGVTERYYVRDDSTNLKPTRTLTNSQEALIMAFMQEVSVEMSLERRPSGLVVRVWREKEPGAPPAEPPELSEELLNV